MCVATVMCRTTVVAVHVKPAGDCADILGDGHLHTQQTEECRHYENL